MHEQRTEPGRGDEAARRARWAPRQAPLSRAPAPEAGALLHAFDAALARQARAEATRARYGRCLADFLRSLGARPPGSLTVAELDSYLEDWRERFVARYGRAPATANYRGQVNALRAFYAYLERVSLLHDGEGGRSSRSGSESSLGAA